MLQREFLQVRYYIDNISKALELFNQIDIVTNFQSFNLLVSLFEAIFLFKGLEYKNLIYKNEERCSFINHSRENLSLDISKTQVVRQRRVNSISESSSTQVPILSLQELKSSPKASPSKISPRKTSPRKISPEKYRSQPQVIHKFFEEKLIENIDINDDSSFMDSKNILLDQFFSKMGLSKLKITEREKSPLKEFLNKSMECPKECTEIKNYIKVKKTNRPSSATPRSMSSRQKSNKNILVEYGSNKKIVNKPNIDDIKQTNFLLGSRFYAKIDAKFIETLCEKLKKDPKDLKTLKTINFEEYSKKKNHYIMMNKNQWVNETLRSLETSDMLVSLNENDLNQDTKHEAMLNHLSQDKHIASLIRKAEHFEISSRKSKK